MGLRKRLQFPVNIKEPNAKMAQFIMSQYGGPYGETYNNATNPYFIWVCGAYA